MTGMGNMESVNTKRGTGANKQNNNNNNNKTEEIYCLIEE